jgi:hypothetical protein
VSSHAHAFLEAGIACGSPRVCGRGKSHERVSLPGRRGEGGLSGTNFNDLAAISTSLPGKWADAVCIYDAGLIGARLTLPGAKAAQRTILDFWFDTRQTVQEMTNFSTVRAHCAIAFVDASIDVGTVEVACIARV